MWGFTRKAEPVLTADGFLKADVSDGSPESRDLKVKWIRNLSYTKMDNAFQEIENQFQSVGIRLETSSGHAHTKTISAMISSIRMEWWRFDRSATTDFEALTLYSVLVDQLPSIAVFHQMKMFGVVTNNDAVSKRQRKSLDLDSWDLYAALADCEKQLRVLYGEQLLRRLEVSYSGSSLVGDGSHLFRYVEEAIQDLHNLQRDAGPVGLFTSKQRSYLREVMNNVLPDLHRMFYAVQHSDVGLRQSELYALLKIASDASAKLEAIIEEHRPEAVFSDVDMHSIPYVFPY